MRPLLVCGRRRAVSEGLSRLDRYAAAYQSLRESDDDARAPYPSRKTFTQIIHGKRGLWGCAWQAWDGAWASRSSASLIALRILQQRTHVSVATPNTRHHVSLCSYLVTAARKGMFALRYGSPSLSAQQSLQALDCLWLVLASGKDFPVVSAKSFRQGSPRIFTVPRSKNRNEAPTQSAVRHLNVYASGESPRTTVLRLHFQQRTAIEARLPTITTLSALLPPALFSRPSRRHRWRGRHWGDDMSPPATSPVR